MLTFLRTLVYSIPFLISAAAAAPPEPDQAARLFVGFAPGGTTDFAGRLAASALSSQLGTQFTVEYKPGGSGAVAANEVANSPPNGKTIYVVDNTYSMLQRAEGSNQLKIDAKLKPVGMIMQAPAVLLVLPTSPLQSVTEIVAQAKQQPGKLRVASAGLGSSTHLYAELFQQQARVKLSHLPLGGSGEALKALHGGQVDMMFTALPAALQQLKEGKLRALAVSTDRRYSVVANVPTFREQGLRGFLVTSWFGLMVPKDTPPEIVTKLNGELQKSLVTPKMRDAVVEAGGSISRLRPEDFENFIKTEIQIWGAVSAIAKTGNP